MQLPPPRLYFPAKAGPFRMAMGLNELDPDEWIELDSNYAGEMALKQRLLTERFADVFSALPGTEGPGRETLELLTEHMARRFPGFFQNQDRILSNALTSETWNMDDSTRHPLEVAARLVQEDLCLMQPRGESWCLTAACVCFPSRWKLAEKMGLPLSGIHSPVPFFEKIGAASDRFLGLLEPRKPVWRMNWSLHDSPELFQPDSPARAGESAITRENAGARVWLRVERQTLRRLPASDAILFTIRTYTRALASLSPPELGELAAAVRSLPLETFAYKGLRGYSQAALTWMDNENKT